MSSLKLDISAMAGSILATLRSSGGGNPIDTNYTWTGNVNVAEESVWFEIAHPMDGNVWLNGEFVEEDGIDQHVFREF